LQRENGGLGVKRLGEFNISLLGKWVWRRGRVCGI